MEIERYSCSISFTGTGSEIDLYITSEGFQTIL